MSHWDEGRLLAYADGELTPAAAAEAREHLESCGPCAWALGALRQEREAFRGALAAVDLTPPTERVRALVEARAGARFSAPRAKPASPPYRRSWWAQRSRLAQAATLVLLLAGGASALMLTPSVRSWLEGPAGAGEAPTPAPLEMESVRAPAEVGAQVGPEAGRIRIAVGGLPTGAEIHVTLVEGRDAVVLGPDGTRFRTGNGQIEAEAPAGPVRVRVPRGVGQVSLEVEGRVYLSVTAGSPLVVVPAFQQSETELRFRIP